MLSNIKRGAVVDTQDGAFGEVYQVIVDPDTKDLTHIVVRPSSGGGDIMAPAEMISSADDAKVVLNVSQSELERRSNELRYDEGEYQAVRPEDVEYQGTAPTQGSPVITAADQDKVSFGDSGAEQPASSTTSYDTDTSTVESHPHGTGQQRKGKELTGLPVMTFAEGEQIGKVKDILFDPEQNRVVALLVDEGGWFSSAKVVPWQNIKTVGVDSVIVPDKSAVVKVDDDPYIKRIMENDNILAGTKVMTEDGRDLGTIGDMYMDDSTGEVVGYEVSGGVFSSTLKGKKFMPAPETISVGKDVAFVPSDVGDQMQAQTGGIVGAAQSAGAAASSGISSAASTVSDQASSAGASASGALAGARDRAVEVTTEQERSYVLGKSTNKDVASDSGEVLVPAGKTVDEGDVQRAENEGKLHALFAATGGAAAGGMLDSIRDKVNEVGRQVASSSAEQRDNQLQNSVGKTVGRDIFADDGTAVALQGTVVDNGTVDRARTYGKEDSLLAAIGLASGQETMGQAKDSVSGAIDSIRTRVSDFSEQRKQGREESRIKSALGRPVTRVILDSNDNVILETAQIVTNQAIEQARTSGVLDILLDSVYEADIELSPEALHSGQSGTASLESQYEQKRKPEDPIT